MDLQFFYSAELRPLRLEGVLRVGLELDYAIT